MKEHKMNMINAYKLSMLNWLHMFAYTSSFTRENTASEVSIMINIQTNTMWFRWKEQIKELTCVAWNVFFPSKLSSRMSMLSAENVTNMPGTSLGGMTAPVTGSIEAIAASAYS